jgi:hypothetical protein
MQQAPLKRRTMGADRSRLDTGCLRKAPTAVMISRKPRNIDTFALDRRLGNRVGGRGSARVCGA